MITQSDVCEDSSLKRTLCDVCKKTKNKNKNSQSSRFFEPPRETKIGSRNREVRKIGDKIRKKIEISISKGNENWFEKLRGLRYQGFEKSEFHWTSQVCAKELLREI